MIDQDLIESIRLGLIKQQAADRLISDGVSQNAAAAILLDAALQGKATIESIIQIPDKDLSGVYHATLRFSYSADPRS